MAATVVVESSPGGGRPTVWVEIDGKIVRGRVVFIGERQGSWAQEPGIDVSTISGLHERRAVETSSLGTEWPFTDTAMALEGMATAEIGTVEDGGY